ncbi:hypothetical protein ACSBR2_023704 [Camellia fascicularis]
MEIKLCKSSPSQTLLQHKPHVLSFFFSFLSSKKLVDCFEGKMDVVKGKKKKSLFVTTWERCRSICGVRENRKSPPKPSSIFSRSNSWHYTTKSSKDDDDKPNTKNHQVIAPQGCFPVYVGPERQRFVVRIQYANHPLFKMLLEDAEMEYGFNSEGPLLLPCEVDHFYKVLAEMKESKEIEQPSCGVACGSYSPFNLCRRRVGNGNMVGKKGCGSYGVLTPS